MNDAADSEKFGRGQMHIEHIAKELNENLCSIMDIKLGTTHVTIRCRTEDGVEQK